MEERTSSGLNFSQFIDKLFWVLIAFLANNISKEASSINDSIKILNNKMAVVVAQLSNQDKRMDGFEIRLNRFEEPRR